MPISPFTGAGHSPINFDIDFNSDVGSNDQASTSTSTTATRELPAESEY